MEKLIAVLPCSNAQAQLDFYTSLGFEVVGTYPRSYLVFRYQEMELHFYGTKMYQPSENPSMCIIQTDDLEQLYRAFTSGLKSKTGKIKRSGFPKVTKIRELSEDWRFTLADPSGNTIYVIQRKPEGMGTYFREIENEQCAKTFAVAYDLIYSKQDLELARKVFSKLAEEKEELDDLDRAKLLLLELELEKQSGTPRAASELAQLIAEHENSDAWRRVSDRFSIIQGGESE